MEEREGEEEKDMEGQKEGGGKERGERVYEFVCERERESVRERGLKSVIN